MQKINTTFPKAKPISVAAGNLASKELPYVDLVQPEINSVDGLTQLRLNLAQLEDLTLRFGFMVKEITGLIK